MMGEWYDVDRDLGGNAWVFKFNGSYVMAMVWMVVRGFKVVVLGGWRLMQECTWLIHL